MNGIWKDGVHILSESLEGLLSFPRDRCYISWHLCSSLRHWHASHGPQIHIPKNMDTQLDKGTPSLMHFQSLELMLFLIFAAWVVREDQRDTSERDVLTPHLTTGWFCTKSFQKSLLFMFPTSYHLCSKVKVYLFSTQGKQDSQRITTKPRPLTSTLLKSQ